MKFSTLWQEFKTFAFKGNMIDLAVAVVIGAAFGGVINSLVKDIIMPSITYVTSGATTAVNTATDVAHKTVSAVGIASQPATRPTTQPAEAAAVTPPAAAAPAPPPPAAPAPAPPAPPPPAAAAPAPPPPAAAPKDEKPVEITWTIGRIRIGNFLGELLNFLLIALAVFLIIVKLLGSVMKKVGGTPGPSEPTTKECPYCLSVIPIKARKCAHCTADLPASSTVAPAPPTPAV